MSAFTRNEGRPSTDTAIPQFFIDTIRGQDLNGQATFKQVELVRIIMPGNPWTQPVMEVTQELIERWPEQYEKFKRMETPAIDGYPIEEWPVLSRAMVRELKSLEIHTVEHCANLSDPAIQKIMGGRILREKAQAY